MPLIKVEILVNAIDKPNPKACQRYDIVTIQPFGHKWGAGDLTGRFVFVTELDLPCGSNWKVTYRCSKCSYDYQMVDWETKPPVFGTKGYTNSICPVQKLGGADVEFMYEPYTNFETLGVVPHTTTNLIHKNAAQIDYTKLSTLDQATIDEVESDPDIITEDQKNARLFQARKTQSKILDTSIKLKTI